MRARRAESGSTLQQGTSWGRMGAWDGWFWIAAIATMALQSFAYRNAMNADGVSYLDMADFIAHGKWARVVNGQWSPLYPAIQGVAMAIVRPSPSQEFPLAHAVNFLIFVAALFGFGYFWQQVAEQASRFAGDSRGQASWSFPLLGYTLFLWLALQLISPHLVTPDLALAGLLCVSCGLVLSIQHQPSRAKFALLGGTLGLGYLCKAVLFPVGVVYLGVVFAVAIRQRQKLVGPLLSVLLFALVSAPWVLAVSQRYGYLTFGETGRFNYWVYVDADRKPTGGDLVSDPGMPHPPRRLFRSPDVWGFDSAPGTIPLWYEPPYWYQGAPLRLDLRRQLRVLLHNLDALPHLGRHQGLLAGCLLILVLLTPRKRSLWEAWLRQWPLWGAGTAGLTLYVLVHMEDRLVGPFLVLLWASGLAATWASPSMTTRRVFPVVTLSLCILVGASALQDTFDSVWTMHNAPPSHFQVAQEFRRYGLRDGDGIAAIGRSNRFYWARLARVHVVAEIEQQDTGEFWSADPEVREKVLEVLAHSGAKMVVSGGPPPVRLSGWERVGTTSFFVHALPTSLR